MTMTKQINKALSNARACRSFRGRDFFDCACTPSHVRWAKRFTARAERRVSKALARGEG
jgi:hypothetical protein